MLPNNFMESDEEYEFGDSIRPRKRQRLTHLTPGEKLQRRKMKNRVAAQAARDRKKAHMDELEDLVKHLQYENQRLARENLLLKDAQVCPNCTTNRAAVKETQQSSISTLVKSEPTSKSAELSPQQKERVQTLLVLMMACYATTLTFHMTYSKYTPSSYKTVSTAQPLDLTMSSQARLRSSQNTFLPWWGPCQNSWNPTKTV